MLAFSHFFLLSKDITDLFGADLPVEGGKGGEFAWRDGPLLAALKAGHWVVLDEVRGRPIVPTWDYKCEKWGWGQNFSRLEGISQWMSMLLASKGKFSDEKNPPWSLL